MAQVALDKGFPLPQVAQSLAPYIKTRQEALRIRRILSVFLAQNIEGTKPLSRTSLAVPSEDARIRGIPAEVSGIRKKYLKALQTHIKAREEYDQFVQGPDEDTLKAMRHEQQQIDDDASAHVATYLDLLQSQRMYQKLSILQDYLDLLAQKHASKSDYLTVESILKEISQPPELLSFSITESSSRTTSSEDTIQALTLHIEKAVLRAQNAVEKERRLLAQVKREQQHEANSDINCPDMSAEIFALGETRDELISWIEQKLADGNQWEDSLDKGSILDRERTSLDVGQRKKAIEAKYEDYLQTRKSLVDLMSERRALPTHKLVTKQEDSTFIPKSKSNETSAYEASLVLPYLTEYIIPASTAQKGFLQQESHLSKTLADQSRETVKVLQRLADESHLLSNYPLLAMQPRFQKTVAAIGSRLRPSTSGTTESGIRPEAQSVTQARAWAFAATAARSTKYDELQERLDHGDEQLEIAKRRIKELKEILGVGSEGGTQDEDEDLWMENVQRSKQKPGETRGVGGKGSLGIWAGLDGNISINDDKTKDKP